MSGPVCVRCGERGADRPSGLGWLHSGCLVIWMIFAQEMGGYSWNYAPELLADLRENDGPERWIPEEA